MKAPLKTFLIATLVTTGALFSSVYTSCNRDKCKSIVCANGGVCTDGSCTCPAGYEGPNCETVSRDKFLGQWQVFEKGSITAAAQYPITIKKATDITEVIIVNFYNYFRTDIKGKVVGKKLYIPNQQYEGKVLFGEGDIITNTTYGQYGQISMRYEIIDTATGAVNDFGYYELDGSDPSMWNK